MSACKQCGLPVTWTKESGKWRCFNEGTKTDHWDSCSQARTARIMRTGEKFEEEHRAGYFTKHKKSGVLLMRQHKDVVVGSKYKPDACACGLPPWELCKEDCEHGIRTRQ